MGKVIKFKTKEEINQEIIQENIQRLNKQSNINKIHLFMDEVRIPRGTYPRGKQHHIQKALRETDGDVVQTEKVLREKGFIWRKSLCYDRMIKKSCIGCGGNILHKQYPLEAFNQ